MNDKKPESSDKKSETSQSAGKPGLPENPISILCNFVNSYNGSRETLTAFLTNCENALSLASEGQKDLLFKFIISKLEGKAQVACSNRIFNNFVELKVFLKQNFGETKHYNHLLLDLQNCKQLSNENVTDFALRIESCLTKIQSEIHNSDSFKKDVSGRIAMSEDLALCTFSLGLSPRISTIVRCHKPKNLNEAINIAIEEEKIQNLTYKNTPKCKKCNKSGHSESECFVRSSRPPNFRPLNSNGTNPGRSNVVCRYCKNIGHDISQCRKRQYNNARFSGANSNNRQFPSQSQNHVEALDPIPQEPDFINNENNLN